MVNGREVLLYHYIMARRIVIQGYGVWHRIRCLNWFSHSTWIRRVELERFFNTVRPVSSIDIRS